MLNPVTEGTAGNVKAVLQEFAGAVITGAVGNITTLTILLFRHAPVPMLPAGVLPHAVFKTYLADIVWQPGVLGITGVAE